MTDKIHFHPQNKDYTQADLSAMSTDDLLALRNLVAAQLGVSAVKGFKDQDTAVAQTWKALTKYDETAKEEAGDADSEAPKKAKAKADKGPRKLAKPAEAGHVKRPTRRMFSHVEIVKPFDGEEDRSFRSKNYKDGMLIIDAIEGEGTLPWDIYNWEKQGYMRVHEPTDEQFAERRAAWYKKHDREDPEAEKERKAKEREEAKAIREAEREAKRKEREEAKAAKAKEREEAKAAKEKAKADAAAAKASAA